VFGMATVFTFLDEVELIGIGALNGDGRHQPLTGGSPIARNWSINVF